MSDITPTELFNPLVEPNDILTPKISADLLPHNSAFSDNWQLEQLPLTTEQQLSDDTTDELTRLSADQPNISIRDLTIEEGDEEQFRIRVRVVLDQPSDQEVTVDFSTFEGTAVRREDFRTKEGTITFEPGQVRKRIRLTVLGDDIREDNETFGIRLENPINANIGDAENTITILNDDFETITTPSGLQYIDVIDGEGPTPTQGQIVTVHYIGTLEDGTQFDSSIDRAQPFSFTLGVGQVIAGWDEGLSTMKEGGQRRLIIPPELGYGDADIPGIPPNSTLVFDVLLLDISDPET